MLWGYPLRLAPDGRETAGHIYYRAMSVTHDPAEAVFSPYNFPDFLRPAGLMSFTLDGLARFAQMHLRGLRGQTTLLAPATLARLHAPAGGGGLNFRGAVGYAAGWEITSNDGVSTHVHDGSLDPYYAIMAIQPERGLAAVAFVNQDQPAGFAVQRAVELLLRVPLAVEP